MNKLLQQALELTELELTDQLVRDIYHHSMPVFVEIYVYLKGKSLDESADDYCRNLRELYFEVRDAIVQNEVKVKKGIEPTKLKSILQSIEKKDRVELPKKTVASKQVEEQIDETNSSIDLPQGSRKDQVAFLIKEKGMSSPTQIAEVLGTNASYVQRLKKQVLNG